jgi:uncharacterized membrane protein
MSLLILVLGFFLLAALILPWINRYQINSMKDEINRIDRSLKVILASLEKNTTEPQATQPEPLHPTRDELLSEEEWASTHSIIETSKTQEAPPVDTFHFDEPPREDVIKGKESVSLEKQFGVRLPVWIGGISLAFAGFYMVKYSIEMGLLSPTVRVAMGLLFGIVLLFSGNWVRRQPRFANGTRIAQALSGAGIAVLYACLYAATNLYNLIPSFLGFAGMAVVTATAVILSLRHGMPIALLGLLGGFVTPAVMSSQNPQAPVLFIYLYFVVAGLMLVIRKQNWWPLSILAVALAYLWVYIWLFGGYFVPGDALTLGLFLMAVSTTVVGFSKQTYASENTDQTTVLKLGAILNYLTIGGSLLLMSMIVGQAGFNPMEWGLFGLLSLGGVVLAYFNQRLYGFVPWVSMAFNTIMLVAWHTHDAQAFALTVSLFGALYIVAGWVFQSRSEKPLLWSGLVFATSIIYYLLGYFRLRDTGLVSHIPLFWGMLAFVLMGVAVYALHNIIRNVPKEHADKQHLLTIYASMCTAFLSIALTIELSREFLPVALALQVCVIAWINTKVEIKALRPLSGAIIFAFLIAMFPQLLLFIGQVLYSLGSSKPALATASAIVNWPVFQLGIPALSFVMSSYLFRIQKNDELVSVLECFAIVLIGMMGYYLIRHAFHFHENILYLKAGFLERGVITNALFIFGLSCLWMGRRLARQPVFLAGKVLSILAIFRICYFDLCLYNPLWSAQSVGSLPLLNALLITYGLPIVWIGKLSQELSKQTPSAGYNRNIDYALMLLLSLVFISLNVRQMYHGTLLNGHEMSNAEIYTYSIVWLIFGAILLVLGTSRKDKMLRLASLFVMIITIGKVFLFDAAELQGMLRVLSFFGLGLSLMALSWFYTRFVFGKTEPSEGSSDKS